MTWTTDTYEETRESNTGTPTSLNQPSGYRRSPPSACPPTEISRFPPPRYRAAVEFVCVIILFSVTACVRSAKGPSLLCGNPDSKVRVAITVKTRTLDLCRTHTIFMNAKVGIECGFLKETYDSKQIQDQRNSVTP